MSGYWRDWDTSPTTKRPYALSLPVIQSSGTGKSRMVEEAAKLIFAIPINVCRREALALSEGMHSESQGILSRQKQEDFFGQGCQRL